MLYLEGVDQSIDSMIPDDLAQLGLSLGQEKVLQGEAKRSKRAVAGNKVSTSIPCCLII